MLKAVASDPLTRYRGDTLPDQFSVTSDGTTLVNLTGYTARMTLNAVKDPSPTDTPLYTLTGAFLSGDATLGVFTFEPSEVQANQTPGKYYYDVELTTPAGSIVTIAKGSYTYRQDISK